MRKTFVISSIALIAGLSGCVPMPRPTQVQKVSPASPFDEDALRVGMSEGHATIRGQAFAKTVGGDVKYAAGNSVTVFPSTAFVRECLTLVSLAPTDCAEQLKPYARTVIADAEGRFEFEGMGVGQYDVWTLITWGVAGPYGVITTGGVVQGRAEIESDNSVVAVHLQ